jgi:hypothetical protein
LSAIKSGFAGRTAGCTLNMNAQSSGSIAMVLGALFSIITGFDYIIAKNFLVDIIRASKRLALVGGGACLRADLLRNTSLTVGWRCGTLTLSTALSDFTEGFEIVVDSILSTIGSFRAFLALVGSSECVNATLKNIASVGGAIVVVIASHDDLSIANNVFVCIIMTCRFVAFIFCRAFLVTEVLWNTSNISDSYDNTNVSLAFCKLAVVDVLSSRPSRAIGVSRAIFAFSFVMNAVSGCSITRIGCAINSIVTILLFASADISTIGENTLSSFA